MAQDAASFKMEIEATSFGFTSLRLISIPSTRISGPASFIVPTPRIKMEEPSAFGWLLVFITLTPAAIPDNDAAIVVTGRLSFSSVKFRLLQIRSNSPSSEQHNQQQQLLQELGCHLSIRFRKPLYYPLQSLGPCNRYRIPKV